jgi:osmotically-inducible protein OsmY
MSATSDRIQEDVRAALGDDPRIAFPDEIAVKAVGDSVLLRGTVGGFGEKQAAIADARRTRGVFTVDDELRVRLMDRDRREDAEIRGAALQRLMSDSQLVADYLGVEVKDGWVTLTGEVDHQFQSDKTFGHVADLKGVTGITNEIRVVEAL